MPPPAVPDGAELICALTASPSDAAHRLGGLVDKSSGSASGPSLQIADILQEASASYVASGYDPLSSLDPSTIAALHRCRPAPLWVGE